MSTVPQEQPGPTGQQPPAKPEGGTRVVPIIFGGLALFVALVLLAGGGLGLWALGERDDEGYFTTHTHQFATPTFAAATSSLDISDAPGWVADGIGTVRIRASSTQPIFVGIGRSSDVDKYLARVPHSEITDFDADPFKVKSHLVPGAGRPAPPASQRFWVAQTSGSGTQTVNWKIESGTWSAVAMNADATRNVAFIFQAGAKVPSLKWVVIGVLVAGVLLLGLGIFLMYRGLRTRSSAPTQA
ncbi:MAG TPA: hypothetical protein VH817_06975 [Thermoleophilaceae bacterium]|jgi:hypothetical protein